MRAPASTVAMFCVIFVSLLLNGVISDPCNAQEITRKEKNALKTIVSTLDRAGRQFQSGNLELSGESIDKAGALFEKLATDPSPDLIGLLKPEHAKMTKGFELLNAQGITLNAIPPLPEAMAADQEENEGEEEANGEVSFQNNVAPILVAHCGRCHVRGRRGQFSAATFTSLMNSGHVDPGKPKVSRLIEVIEDGDMPPGGSLLPKELEVLKQWIAQGAKTDADQNANLATLAQNAAAEPAAPEEANKLTVNAPKGTDTVSFANDIAPVLIENCAGCHVDVRRNARGGLNMTNFQQILAGGDSGPILQPGAGAKSLLIKKLRGTATDGVQMPQGRPPLDESVIKMVQKWIDEGASFDGAQPTSRVRIVAATAKAEGMSHEELSAQRKQLAADNWQTVMSDIKSNLAEQPDLRVLSSYDTERTNEIAEVAQAVIPKIRSTMKIKGDDPLVKGKITVFVFERRYDFNEFGVMIDRQEIPRQVKSRWGYDVVDANVALLMTRDQTPENLQASLARQMGTVYVASIAPDAPNWFIEGMGYWIASKATPRAEGVSTWDEEAEALAKQMAKPDDFIRGQLPDDQTALVGYYFVSQLRGKNSGKFSRLIGMLEEGQAFETAFKSVYRASPSKYVGGK